MKESVYEACKKFFDFGFDPELKKVVKHPGFTENLLSTIGGKEILTVEEEAFNDLFYGDIRVDNLIKEKNEISESLEKERNRLELYKRLKEDSKKRKEEYKKEMQKLEIEIELILAKYDMVKYELILQGKIMYSELILKVENLQESDKKAFLGRKLEFKAGITVLKEMWEDLITEDQNKTIEKIYLWREILKGSQESITEN